MQENFISPKEVQNMLKISRVTEISWRKAGYLPQPIILGRRVFYRESDLKTKLCR